MKRVRRLAQKKIMVGIGGLALLGLGAWSLLALSASSTPGELTYPIKRAGENTQQMVSLTPHLAATTHLRIAASKTKELEKLDEIDGNGHAFTRTANQLTEQILAAENNIMLIKVGGKSIAKFKEELCDSLEDYQKRLDKVAPNVPADAKKPFKNLMDVISDGISKAMGW